MEIKAKYWYQQAIGILSECINDLSYAYTENTLSDKKMRTINYKIRELSDMIPDWDATFRKKGKLGYKTKKRVSKIVGSEYRISPKQKKDWDVIE